MASRAEGFGWLAVVLAVLVWVLCAAVPLGAQVGGGLEGGGARRGASAWGVGTAEAGISLDGSTPAGVTWGAAGVPATADAVIEEMARASGAIFVGRVAAIRRPVGMAGSGEDAAEGVVEVDFLVDEGVRGAATGTVYTLREWAGLWSASGGAERYRVGQRLLVFLYPADAAGLSSPVRGRDGAVPVRGSGIAPGPDDATNGVAQWMVDLRWVQTQVVKQTRLQVRPPALPRPIHGILPESEGRGAMDVAPEFVRVPVTAPVVNAAPAQQQPLAQVIALCQQTMESSDARR